MSQMPTKEQWEKLGKFRKNQDDYETMKKKWEDDVKRKTWVNLSLQERTAKDIEASNKEAEKARNRQERFFEQHPELRRIKCNFNREGETKKKIMEAGECYQSHQVAWEKKLEEIRRKECEAQPFFCALMKGIQPSWDMLVLLLVSLILSLISLKRNSIVTLQEEE